MVTVKSNENGLVDLEDLKRVVDEDTAALMLTNPNTLGLFEKKFLKWQKLFMVLVGKCTMMVQT